MLQDERVIAAVNESVQRINTTLVSVLLVRGSSCGSSSSAQQQ